MLAAAGGHVEVCEALLLRGVDVSGADDVSSIAFISLRLFSHSKHKMQILSASTKDQQTSCQRFNVAKATNVNTRKFNSVQKCARNDIKSS